MYSGARAQFCLQEWSLYQEKVTARAVVFQFRYIATSRDLGNDSSEVKLKTKPFVN